MQGKNNGGNPKRSREENLRYLKDPKLWPNFPIMPMKRIKPIFLAGRMQPRIASIVALEGKKTTLLFDDGDLLFSKKYHGRNWDWIFRNVPSKFYESPEAILDDGWECD